MSNSPAFNFKYLLPLLAALLVVAAPGYHRQKLAVEEVLRQRSAATAEVLETTEGYCGIEGTAFTRTPCALVRYHFTHGGKTYEKTAGFSGWPEAVEETYRPGGDFVACYEYDDPDNSMLYRRPHRCGEE